MSTVKLAMMAVVAALSACAADEIVCEGAYGGHLQGVATDGTSIYWSHTVALVKTDRTGRILRSVPAPRHQGDLCFHDGVLYVAVNLGRFDTHTRADNWIFAYDPQTLKETKRWKIPEPVHGAGGITWANGRFFVVGGLTLDIEKNYIYEYTSDFAFVRRHELDTGFTHMGIQTAAFEDGRFLFGIYGSAGNPGGSLECPPTLDSFVRRRGAGNVGIVKLDGEYWTGRVFGRKSDGLRGKLVRSPGYPASEAVYVPGSGKGTVRLFFEGRDVSGWKDAGYRFDADGNVPLCAAKGVYVKGRKDQVLPDELPAVGIGGDRAYQVNDLVRGVRRTAETGEILAFHVPGTPETLKDDPKAADAVKALRDEAVLRKIRFVE